MHHIFINPCHIIPLICISGGLGARDYLPHGNIYSIETAVTRGVTFMFKPCSEGRALEIILVARCFFFSTQRWNNTEQLDIHMCMRRYTSQEQYQGKKSIIYQKQTIFWTIMHLHFIRIVTGIAERCPILITWYARWNASNIQEMYFTSILERAHK